MSFARLLLVECEFPGCEEGTIMERTVSSVPAARRHLRDEGWRWTPGGVGDICPKHEEMP